MTAATRVCARCGHSAGSHEHYRPGTDCGQCSCPRLRRRWTAGDVAWTVRLLWAMWRHQR